MSGPATVSFDLLRPLRSKGVGGHLQGTVALQGARLADARWNLAFDQVSGQADYRDTGFAAEQLSVQHQGRSGALSLRAGGFVQDPKQAFEARFAATLDAKELFDRAPQMEWLRPYVHGSAPWQVGVDVPLPPPGQTDAKAMLSLRSDWSAPPWICLRRWTRRPPSRWTPRSRWPCRSAMAISMWRSASWWRSRQAARATRPACAW